MEHKSYSEKDIKSSIAKYKIQARKASFLMLAPLLLIFLQDSDIGPEWLRSVSFFKYSLVAFIVVGVFAIYWPYDCTRCKKPVSLGRGSCPNCKIPLRAKTSLYRKVISGFVAVIILVALMTVFFPGQVMKFGFQNSDLVNKDLQNSIDKTTEIFDRIRKGGKVRSLDNPEIAENYDTTTWHRIGFITLKKQDETSKKLILMYNFDSEQDVEAYLKTNPTVKCHKAVVAEGTMCIPVEYFEDETGFRRSNNIARSKEYMAKQFDSVGE